MSKNNHEQDVFEGEVLFDKSLDDVPNTESLQARILQATHDLPQQLDADLVEPVIHSPSLFKQAMPFALAASIALFAFLALPGLLDQSSVNDAVFASDLSVDDLDYHEAILMYDEFMFAQL